MKTAFLSGVLICATASIGLSEGMEQRITIGEGASEIVGTLALPAAEAPPVVLLLHGFTGSRDELAIPNTEDGVFSRTARLLAEAGLASLRIDFRGSGESLAEMQFADTTFESQIADAERAVDYLQSLESVDGDDIHVIGWSQGGLVASSLAGRGAEVDSLSLWQAVGDPDATYSGIVGAETLEKGLSLGLDEPLTVKLPWGAEIQLNGAFFQDVVAHDPMAEIAGYAGPLFVTKGMKDTTVPPAVSDAYLAAHEGPEVLWTREMDHVFNIFGETETLDAMVAATIDFIKAQDD